MSTLRQGGGARLVGMSPRKPKRPRSVKVSDDLWEQAQARADERGEYVSEVIRRALEAYVRGDGKVTRRY